MWQDYAVSCLQFVFILFMFPMIFSKDKAPVTTSLPFGVALVSMGVVFSTIPLWWSAATSATCGILWLVVASQKLRQNRLEVSRG